MDIDTLKMIVALAEEKDYRRAAKRLNIPFKKLDSTITALQQDANLRLLETGFVGFFLTDQGQELYEKAKQILHDLETFDKWMHGLKNEPAGTITIVTMPFTGIEWLMPKLDPFLRKYPKVNIRLLLKNPPLQPGEGDVVISFPLIGPRGRYVSLPLMSATYSLYASPAYLKEYGTPKTFKDLENHKIIAFGTGNLALQGHFSWTLTYSEEREGSTKKPYFEVDTSLGTLRAAKLGLGIAELPDFDFIEQSPDLVKVLPSSQTDKTSCDFIVEKNRENSPAIGELYRYLRTYCLPAKK